MASGDKFLWMINFVTKFKAHYHIEIPQFDRTTEPADVKLLRKFPYKQITLGVSGTGFYHDIGKFISDFENQFSTSYILNLELQPSSNQSSDEREKLSFRMQILTLVKSDEP
jgi:Tfp pilus assembly protein PilO